MRIARIIRAWRRGLLPMLATLEQLVMWALATGYTTRRTWGVN